MQTKMGKVGVKTFKADVSDARASLLLLLNDIRKKEFLQSYIHDELEHRPNKL